MSNAERECRLLSMYSMASGRGAKMDDIVGMLSDEHRESLRLDMAEVEVLVAAQEWDKV